VRIKGFVSLALAAALAFTMIPVSAVSAAPLTAVKINDAGVDYLTLGQTVALSAAVTPTGADDLVWSVCEQDGVTPTAKATIDQTGLLTAVSGGYVTAVASNAAGSIRSSYPLFILDQAKQYNIINKASGLAVTANGTAIQISALTNSDAQKWKLAVVAGTSYVTMQNVSTANYINATSATAVSLAAASGGNAQQFALNGRIPYTATNFTNYGCNMELGTFKLVNRNYTTAVLNESGTAANSAVNMAASASETAWNELTQAQKFLIVDAADPVFTNTTSGYRKITGTIYGSPDGPYGGNAANAFTAAFDGNTSTFFDNSAGTGYAGMQFGAPKVVKAIRVYPRTQCGMRVYKGFIQGSNDGVNYTNLYEFNYAPCGFITTAPYTSFYINNNTAYTYYRYISPSWGYGDIAEVEFYEALDPNALDITMNAPPAIAIGENYTFAPTFMTQTGVTVTPDSVTFTSLTPQFATVTPAGFVTGVAAGSAVIKCSAVYKGQTWENTATISIFQGGVPVISARSFSEMPARTAIYSTIGDANSAFEGNAIGTLGNGNEFLYMVNNLNVKLANLYNDNAKFDLVLNGGVFLYGKAQTRNNNQNDQTTWKNNFAAGYTPTSNLVNNEYAALKYSSGTNDLFTITVEGSKLHVAVTPAGVSLSNTASGLVIPISAYIPAKTAVTLSVDNMGSPAMPITTQPLYADQAMKAGDPIPINVLIDTSKYPYWPLPVPVRKTPMMGWSSWNCFGLNITEDKIKGQIDAFVKDGLRDVGYKYVNIDDGYQKGRDDVSGLVNYDTTKFPKGMKDVADYAHENGLLAGMYTDAGDNTCGSGASTAAKGNYGFNVGFYDGVEKHPNEQRDAPMYMHDWSYNFMKTDWCGGGHANPGQEQTRYTSISNEIRKVAAADNDYKVFNICRWQFPGSWAPDVADSWRTSGDISASWSSILSCLDTVKSLAQYCGPGHVNDPDMLEVGNGSLTYDQNKSHFSMWCMVCAPLALGNDLRTISQETLSILKNTEIIAIDQDPAVIQAHVARTVGTNGEIWVRDLGKAGSNVKAVALLNRDTAAPLQMTLDFAKDLGFYGGVVARDLWLHQEIDVGSAYTVTVPPCGVVVLKVTSGATAAVSGDLFNSKLGPAPAEVNLTQVGTDDWKAFASGAVKSASVNMISDANTGVAPAPYGVALNWSDGKAPNASGTSSQAAAITAPGASYQFTIPAGMGPGYRLNGNWTLYRGVSTAPTGPNEITTTLAAGDIYSTNPDDAINLYYVDPPAGNNFDATVKVTTNFSSNYPTAGIIAWVDKANYVMFLRRYHSNLVSTGKCFDLVSEVNSVCDESGAVADATLGWNGDVAYIRLQRNGDSFTGSVSPDGVTWTNVSTKTNATVANNANLKVGLFSNGPTSYVVKYNDFKLGAIGAAVPVPFATYGNSQVSTYLGASNARVKVETTSGNKTSVSYIDSPGKESDAVLNTELLETQTMPLGVKVTLEQAYGANGSALIGAAAVGVGAVAPQPDPSEFFYASDHSTTGQNIDLDNAGQLDWVTFAANGGARKAGGNYLDSYTTSGAVTDSPAADVSYAAGGAKMPAGVAQSGAGSYFDILLPPSDTLKKADIYFGVRNSEVAVNVSTGTNAYSYDVFDAGGGQGSVVSVWYKGKDFVHVVLSTTVAVSADSQLRLDAVAISGADYVFDPAVTYADGVLSYKANVANYSGAPDTAHVIAAAYDAGSRLAAVNKSPALTGLTAGVQAVPGSMTVPAAAQNGSVKFFLWNDVNAPLALSQSYDLPVSATTYAVPFKLTYIGNLTAKADVANGAKLVDVRTPAEYAAGHITWDGGGAYNAPLENLIPAIEAIPGMSKATEIILYDDNALKSVTAARILNNDGYTKVFVLGSMSNWYMAVQLIMPTSVPDRYINNPIIIRYENVSTYDAGSYTIWYSLGGNSTAADAVPYPSGGINLTGPNTVKAYLKYNGQVVAQAQDTYDPYIAEPLPANPDVYASDMTWISVTQGYGTTQRDKSIDGNTLTLCGNTFAKGIGTHATGAIEIAIPANATAFTAVAGIDDEVTLTRGNQVKFSVYVDGALIDQSPNLIPGQYKVFNIDLTGYTGGGHVLRLAADETADGKDYDHAVWCNAGFKLLTAATLQ